MRKACIDCVTKHLGQAFVLHAESKLGYPEYYVAVIGHLQEASEECFQRWPKLAEEIRQERIKLLLDVNYELPYLEIFKQVLAIKRIVDAEAEADEDN